MSESSSSPNMCRDSKSHRRLRRRSSSAKHPHSSPTSCRCLVQAWLASRVLPCRRGVYLVPGAQRPINESNVRLALTISRACVFDLVKALWALHPIRTGLMMTLHIVRAFFPAFRGYSQAMIVDEVCFSHFVSTAHTEPCSCKLYCHRAASPGHDLLGCYSPKYFAELRKQPSTLLRTCPLLISLGIATTKIPASTSNDTIVHESARFYVEYQQIAQRLRLDIPTLADPIVRDCLQESDLFVRSFNGMGGFGLLSPFDFIQVIALMSELASHILVLLSLTGGSTNVAALLLSVLSALFPLFMNRWGNAPSASESTYSSEEARTAERQERLRNLAYNNSHRPEVLLFGLGPWILQSWANARRTMMFHDQKSSTSHLTLPQLLHQINVSDLLFALQNVSFITARVRQLRKNPTLDSIIAHVSVVIRFLRFASIIPELHPGCGVYFRQSPNDNTYGISKHLPDGSFLCCHEYSSGVGTYRRR